MAENSQRVEYPWESPEYAEDLRRRVRTAAPEWYQGPLYAYLPTRAIARHFIDSVQVGHSTSVAEFLRANLGFVIASSMTGVLAALLAVLLSRAVSVRPGPIALVLIVVVTAALVFSAVALLLFVFDERIDWSPAITTLNQLEPTYGDRSFETVSHHGRDRLEHNVQLVLRERIGLWMTGLAAGLDAGTELTLIAGHAAPSIGHPDNKDAEKWARPLRETLGLTPTQFARVEHELMRELRSAASHHLIDGHWGRLVDRNGELVVTRRTAG